MLKPNHVIRAARRPNTLLGAQGALYAAHCKPLLVICQAISGIQVEFRGFIFLPPLACFPGRSANLIGTSLELLVRESSSLEEFKKVKPEKRTQLKSYGCWKSYDLSCVRCVLFSGPLFRAKQLGKGAWEAGRHTAMSKDSAAERSPSSV